MNVNKVMPKEYEKKDTWWSGKNKAKTKPNKANLLNDQMNVTSFLTKEYENISNCTLSENKPNTNPIQNQTNPIPPVHKTTYDIPHTTYEIQTQLVAAPWSVEQFLYGLRDSLRFYELPKWWWKRVRTNNPLERLIRTLRDRLRPMGCFHDERAIERAVFGQLLRWQKSKLAHNT